MDDAKKQDMLFRAIRAVEQAQDLLRDGANFVDMADFPDLSLYIRQQAGGLESLRSAVIAKRTDLVAKGDRTG